MGALEKALKELDDVADDAMAKRLGFFRTEDEEAEEESKSGEENISPEEIEKLKALLSEG